MPKGVRETRYSYTPENIFACVGRKTLTFFEDVGGLALLIKDIILGLPKAFTRFHLTAEQANSVRWRCIQYQCNLVGNRL